MALFFNDSNELSRGSQRELDWHPQIHERIIDFYSFNWVCIGCEIAILARSCGATSLVGTILLGRWIAIPRRLKRCLILQLFIGSWIAMPKFMKVLLTFSVHSNLVTFREHALDMQRMEYQPNRLTCFSLI